MGQKSNPIGLRLQINRTWDSRWYAEGRDYAGLLKEDIEIRKYIIENLPQAAISKVVIERPAKLCRVSIYAARPGVIIGKKGADIEKLRAKLSSMTESEVKLNIVEIRKPEIDAKLVAQGVADQLIRRVAFRRAMKRAVQSALRLGAEGIKITCGGRLGGAEIARVEWYREGRVPLHTLRANVDYAEAEALTAYGIIGIKVWIFKGDIMMQADRSHLPLKLNTAGVIPPIFASSLLLLPLTITQFAGTPTDPTSATGGFTQSLLFYLQPGQWIYLTFYAVLIVFFCFFYTAVVFNPEETADNLKKNGGFIPGIRPGKRTADYLEYVLTRITVVGAIYLAFVCVLPEWVIREAGLPVIALGGTSLLIVVNVTVDTISQIQSHLLAHQYGDLIKKAKLKGRMALKVSAVQDGLEFVSDHYFVSVLGRRVRLPKWLEPGVTKVRHIDQGEGAFLFSLEVQHRWLGELVYQQGRFSDVKAA